MSDASRDAAAKARVAAENLEAANRARQMQEEQLKREQLIRDEAEKTRQKRAIAANFARHWETRLKEPVRLESCVLLPDVMLHVMSFLQAKELLSFSSTCLWARQKALLMFQRCFNFGRPSASVWQCQKGHNWMQRCFRAKHVQGLEGAMASGSDFFVLTEGDHVLTSQLQIRRDVTFEGASSQVAALALSVPESVDAVKIPPSSPVRICGSAWSLFAFSIGTSVSFRNLTLFLAGSSSEYQYSCLTVFSSFLTLENVFVESMQHAALHVVGGKVHARNCSFFSKHSNNIHIEGSTICTLDRVLCCRSANVGLEIIGCATVNVFDSVFAGNKLSGISIVDSAREDENERKPASVTISSSFCFDNEFFGIEVMSTNCKVQIEGSRISRNAVGVVRSQFGLWPISGVCLENCKMYDNGEDERIRQGNESMQELANAAVSRGDCPVSATGPHFVTMQKFDCYTCGMVGSLVLCSVCAKEHEDQVSRGFFLKKKKKKSGN